MIDATTAMNGVCSNHRRRSSHLDTFTTGNPTIAEAYVPPEYGWHTHGRTPMICKVDATSESLGSDDCDTVLLCDTAITISDYQRDEANTYKWPIAVAINKERVSLAAYLSPLLAVIYSYFHPYHH